MRACVQRVSQAHVSVAFVTVANQTAASEAGESKTGEREIVGQIAHGLVVLLGVAADDTPADAVQLAEKISELRIFSDDAGKMNRSLVDTGGAMLVVSQFTLLGDCRKGRRPSFVDAAPPQLAEQLYEIFVVAVKQQQIEVATGRFRADMQVMLVNDGPVTMLLDSRKQF